MKVVKFFSIALVSSFLVASSAFATVNDKLNSDEKAAQNTVRGQVANILSTVSVDSSDAVFVYFFASKEGLKVVDVKGSNAELAAKVKAVLSTKSIETSAALDGKYLLKVSFIND